MKTRPFDIESDTSCSLNLPTRPVIGDVSKAGLRGRKHPQTRLVLTPRIVARFLSKVQQGNPDQCWPWMAGKFSKGYGQFNAGRDATGRQDTRYAHRVAYQIATGIDPVDVVVMHSCDNPPCCNPAHLSLGTSADNIADAVRKGKYARNGEHRRRKVA